MLFDIKSDKDQIAGKTVALSAPGFVKCSSLYLFCAAMYIYTSNHCAVCLLYGLSAPQTHTHTHTHLQLIMGQMKEVTAGFKCQQSDVAPFSPSACLDYLNSLKFVQFIFCYKDYSPPFLSVFASLFLSAFQAAFPTKLINCWVATEQHLYSAMLPLIIKPNRDISFITH